jgi:hypothetical protein
MTGILKAGIYFAALAIALPAAPALLAQHAAQPVLSQAPVPAQIKTARKLFISNAGGEPSSGNADPDRGYNELYGAIQGMGNYELVAGPAEADLVLELSVVLSPAQRDSRIRWVVLDPKTRVTLWALTEYVRDTYLPETHRKNFDLAMTEIMNDYKKLAR